MNKNDLKIGNIISNDEISEIFSCGAVGSIRLSNSNNLVVAIANHQNPKQNYYWNGNVLHFIAAGNKGDQNLNNYRNKAIIYAKKFSREIHLFEKFTSHKNVYRGLVILKDEPREVVSNNILNNRKVYEFLLQPIRKVINESLYEKLETVEISISDNIKFVDSLIEKNKVDLLAPINNGKSIVYGDEYLDETKQNHLIEFENNFYVGKDEAIESSIWRAYAEGEVEPILEKIESIANQNNINIVIPYYDLERGSITTKFIILATAVSIVSDITGVIADYQAIKTNIPELKNDISKVLTEVALSFDGIGIKILNNLPKEHKKINHPNLAIPIRHRHPVPFKKKESE